MRIVLVDDEPPGRLALRENLAAMPDAEIVAECRDGAEAVEAVVAHAPDLLLLDVQMPGLSGFEVLERLGADAVPAVVFVTAHDRYAVRAFEANAVDYLLKPIDPDRFREAYHRAAQRVAQGADPATHSRLEALVAGAERPPLDRVVVREGGRLVFVGVEQIDWIEAAGNYVKLHCGGRERLLRRPLQQLAARLGQQFVRIGRSTLVHRRAIQALEPYGKGSYAVFLRDGTHLVSSRYAGRALREMLER